MIHTREIAEEYRLSHWAQVMHDRVQSGLNIKEYCHQIGICGNTYFYWQRKLREAAREGLIVKPQKELSITDTTSLAVSESLTAYIEAGKALIPNGFAEVELPTVIMQEQQPSESDICGEIRIEAAGIRMTANSAYPAMKIAELVRSLLASC